MPLSDTTHITVIGGGKMGEAILAGWLASDVEPAAVLTPESFTVVDPGGDRREYLSQKYGVRCVMYAHEATVHADIVLLAVKPQTADEVMAQISHGAQFEGCLYISIMAGIATQRLEGLLPASARLVRTMPNMPLLVGKGATAVCTSATAHSDDVMLVQSLFACLGEAEVVDEEALDAVCGVSGSGPAYVASMIEWLARAGAAQGLDYDLAEHLATQTVYGTASLMLETGRSACDIRESVSSPHGTTVAALHALELHNAEAAYHAAVDAAVKRSKELSEC